MKLILPKFEDFEFDNPFLNPENIVPTFRIYHPFFEGYIMIDGPSKTNKYFMYGYIGTSYYYDDRIVASDDIDLDETGDGMIEKSILENTYNIICEQLSKRYEEWALNNIVKE